MRPIRCLPRRPAPNPDAPSLPGLDAPPVTRPLIDRYLHLTRQVMPGLAAERPDWPVRQDHCFQRIVLDAVCGGVWHDHIARPARRHMTDDQAARAVQVCDQIIAGRVDLAALNRQSLVWRGKCPQ